MDGLTPSFLLLHLVQSRLLMGCSLASLLCTAASNRNLALFPLVISYNSQLISDGELVLVFVVPALRYPENHRPC